MIVFIDFEASSLYGSAFAGTMLSESGEVLFSGWTDDVIPCDWVAKNVLPVVAGVGTHYKTLGCFLKAFSKAWLELRASLKPSETLSAVAHMGSPVESGLFSSLVQWGLIGEFDGPFPLFDTAPLLYSMGHNPASEEAYATKIGIMPHGHQQHNHLHDAHLTRLVWRSLTATIGDMAYEKGVTKN